MAMTQPMMELNSQNYHSTEANRRYMSHSQYQDFLSCEAMAMAKLFDGWKEPENTDLLVGSYVHAAIEGKLDEFKIKHPELFTKKGELYAQYKHADKMIEALKSDEFIQFVLTGEKEVIITADMFGVTWKAKLDTYNPGAGRIVDIKTTRSIRDKYWHKDYGYVSFVEAFGYITQIAIYAEIERLSSGRDGWLETLIVAISKEDPPDKEIILIDEDRIRIELEEVERNMERIIQVKQGKVEPERCEKCRYCRETKKVKKIVHYLDLIS